MNFKRPHWLLLFAALGCLVVGLFVLSASTQSDFTVTNGSIVANDINSQPHWILWADCGGIFTIIGVIGIISFLLWMLLKVAIRNLLRPLPGPGLFGHTKRILFVLVVVIEVGIIGMIGIFCATLIAWSFSDHHPSSEFGSDARSLRYARDYWISHGRSADFRLEEVLGPPEDFFIYTNTLRTTNGVFHIRFGSRRPGWPPGTLAITDEGQMIFVCSTNGKVTISPDEYGVDP
jgi:hypothetical protein